MLASCRRLACLRVHHTALRALLQVSTHAIYSMHKSSTRPHIHQVATQQLGAASAEVLAELRYDLPASYVFHK